LKSQTALPWMCPKPTETFKKLTTCLLERTASCRRATTSPCQTPPSDSHHLKTRWRYSPPKAWLIRHNNNSKFSRRRPNWCTLRSPSSRISFGSTPDTSSKAKSTGLKCWLSRVSRCGHSATHLAHSSLTTDSARCYLETTKRPSTRFRKYLKPTSEKRPRRPRTWYRVQRSVRTCPPTTKSRSSPEQRQTTNQFRRSNHLRITLQGNNGPPHRRLLGPASEN